VIVFIDFEATSLGRHGVPIEVGWVAEDGVGEGCLIRPAPGWTDWSDEAAAVHGITREDLERDGEDHAEVARRLLVSVGDQPVYASAPSWDGQWLSRLLRAAGLPRHALRLRHVSEARAEAALAGFAAAGIAPELRADLAVGIVAEVLRRVEAAGPPRHRALDDARRELLIWREIGRDAALVAGGGGRAIVAP
jgi:hypothetical protein